MFLNALRLKRHSERNLIINKKLLSELTPWFTAKRNFHGNSECLNDFKMQSHSSGAATLQEFLQKKPVWFSSLHSSQVASFPETERSCYYFGNFQTRHFGYTQYAIKSRPWMWVAETKYCFISTVHGLSWKANSHLTGQKVPTYEHVN